MIHGWLAEYIAGQVPLSTVTENLAITQPLNSALSYNTTIFCTLLETEVLLSINYLHEIRKNKEIKQKRGVLNYTGDYSSMQKVTVCSTGTSCYEKSSRS